MTEVFDIPIPTIHLLTGKGTPGKTKCGINIDKDNTQSVPYTTEAIQASCSTCLS